MDQEGLNCQVMLKGCIPGRQTEIHIGSVAWKSVCMHIQIRYNLVACLPGLYLPV
jgi:hypothetical protein